MDKQTRNAVDSYLNNLDNYTDKNLILETLHLFQITNCNILDDDPISRTKKVLCKDRHNLTSGMVGVIDIVKCGIDDKKLNTYILKSTHVNDQNVKISPPEIYNGPNIQKFIHPIKKWVGSDEFTNEALITWILNKEIPYYSVQQYLVFICDNKGYQIQEKANSDLSGYISSNKFNAKNFDKMVYQLVTTLNFLQKKYNFIHGDMKAKNVLVFNNGNLAKISDYGKSSITFNGYRYYCRLEKFVKRRFAGLFPTSSAPKNKKYLYDLNSVDTAVAMRHRKEIFYLNFDIYTLMLSIALERKIFYNYIVGDSKGLDFFKSLWNFLWVDETSKKKIEYKIENMLLNESINPGSYTTVIKVLAGFELKYF